MSNPNPYSKLPKMDLESTLMYAVASKPKTDTLTDEIINGSINWASPKNRKQNSKLLENFRAYYGI